MTEKYRHYSVLHPFSTQIWLKSDSFLLVCSGLEVWRSTNWAMGWERILSQKLSKLQKTLKIGQKRWKTAIFQRFFEVYSILAEKQRTKPKKLRSLKNFASLSTHIAPKFVIIVEQLQVLLFVSRVCDESALWCFFFFSSKWSLMSSNID